MAKVERISLDVTAEMAASLREAVSKGEFVSTDEAMREALRQWQQRRSERERARAELGRLWDEGLASGDFRDADEVFAELAAELDEGSRAARTA